MKEFFEELEAEVDQHVVDRKHDEIERKNLPIANDNLIAHCLDVFHVATNSELNVSSFTAMHFLPHQLLMLLSSLSTIWVIRELSKPYQMS
ncbi:hypothetical protein Tco_0447626 [Tanacetum coccineum]